ncbi:MAG TPA: type II secretion system protein [Verrucomicrobiae bacterium]|jgi:prepilin-type N-terminal cleavage/methylation domain-containing protein
MKPKRFTIYDLRFTSERHTPRAGAKFGRAISAFTLIELLAVIAVIGVLAAFLLTVMGGVTRTKYINTATAQMHQIETALDSYKAAYGTYPPAGTNCLMNPLYYELVGTTNSFPSATPSMATTLDGAANGAPAGFGMSGFINCNKPGSGGENSAQARDFLLDLKTTQLGNITNSVYTNYFLVTSIGGPDAGYEPAGMPAGMQGVNPWRYAYPGTNNPNGYDLWIQLVINRKTNLVCNWSGKVQLNTQFP